MDGDIGPHKFMTFPHGGRMEVMSRWKPWYPLPGQRSILECFPSSPLGELLDLKIKMLALGGWFLCQLLNKGGGCQHDSNKRIMS